MESLGLHEGGITAPARPLHESVSRFVRRWTPTRQLPALLLLLAGERSRLLRAHGYGRSLKRMLPLDEHEDPIPWMPYCMTSLLKERLSPAHDVLEFGAGYSTLFFMRRVASVVAIEHDREWAEHIGRRADPNVRIRIAAADSPEAYCLAIESTAAQFDLVLVDGRHRVQCFKRALTKLKGGGVVILDDSDRPDYAEALALGTAQGFKLLHLEGHKPGSIGLHRSTLFYRPGNCLGL